MTPEYSEVIAKLEELRERIQELGDVVRVEENLRRIAELESQMGEPRFWDHNERAQDVIRELKALRAVAIPFRELKRSVGDMLELAEMAAGEDDPGALPELRAECERLDRELESLEVRTTLSDKYDANNAFLSVHAGSGGTESFDWAAMLARMLERYCEKQGFDITLVDRLEGEEAGIRSATYLVKGDMAYGYLRSEIGVHRLVRKSPFDARHRRHTSFAAVDVIPEIEADEAVEVNESDLRIDTFRAGGAGGQHVNVTDSAVRITHLPTGVVVQCQNERSQHANRAMALKMLKARLLAEKERQRREELEVRHGEKGEATFGSQIRNYVLEPYTQVKDRRTGHETGNAQAVLDGEILPFVEAYLRWKRKHGAQKKADKVDEDA